PVIELGLWWMRGHAPKDAGEMRLCWGDVGANQFMFDGDRLTGLLDAELARIGHPLVDIGCMRYRAVFYPIGDMVPHLRHYEELSGRPLDLERFQYYTMMAPLYGRLGFTEKISKPDAWSLDQVAVQSFDPPGRRAIIEVMLDSYGIDLDLPRLPEPD